MEIVSIRLLENKENLSAILYCAHLFNNILLREAENSSFILNMSVHCENKQLLCMATVLEKPGEINSDIGHISWANSEENGHLVPADPTGRILVQKPLEGRIGEVSVRIQTRSHTY